MATAIVSMDLDEDKVEADTSKRMKPTEEEKEENGDTTKKEEEEKKKDDADGPNPLIEFVDKTSLTMDYVDICSYLETLTIPWFVDDVPLWLYAARKRNVKVYTAALMEFCFFVDSDMGGEDEEKGWYPALVLQKGFDFDLSDLVTKELKEDEQFIGDYKGVTDKKPITF